MNTAAAQDAPKWRRDESFSIAERLWARRTLYLFLLPFAVLTALFGIWPIGQSIYVAFTESYTALSPNPKFVGFDNFETILTDTRFQSSMGLTLLYTGLSVVLNVSVALGLAILLSTPSLTRGRALFKLAMFLPVITPDVAGFIVWKWMFNTDFGVVNASLLSLGLPAFAGITTSSSAFVTLLIAELWKHVGLYTLIFLTNLQLLDRALSESAEIDGATRWQNFRHVTLPQLRPAIAINVTYALIQFLKTFSVVMVMTKGGPNFATNFVSFFAYTKFDSAQYGEATAMATVLFVGVAAISLGTFYFINKGDRR